MRVSSQSENGSPALVKMLSVIGLTFLEWKLVGDVGLGDLPCVAEKNM